MHQYPARVQMQPELQVVPANHSHLWDETCTGKAAVS